MPSLDKIIQTDPIRGIVYGPSGSGKTTLIGGLAAFDGYWPMYWFDWDLRIAAIQARLNKEYWSRITADPYRDLQVQGEAWSYMQAKLEKVVAEGYKTAVVDSASFCMKGLMARVLALDGNKPATFTPQLQHYMQLISLFEEMISRLCSKPINVFITCHEDTTKDEITGRLFKGLDLTGKAANRIPGYFNEFWHTEVVQGSQNPEPEFRVRTRSDMIFQARTTYRSLAAVEKQELVWPKVIAERKERVVAATVIEPASKQ